ncbi:kinase-like domain-containing protein [Phlyctochytrium arcticum]|nr:kinase-like domain-containing protein [Phlyctochytrium arcticum]
MPQERTQRFASSDPSFLLSSNLVPSDYQQIHTEAPITDPRSSHLSSGKGLGLHVPQTGSGKRIIRMDEEAGGIMNIDEKTLMPPNVLDGAWVGHGKSDDSKPSTPALLSSPLAGASHFTPTKLVDPTPNFKEDSIFFRSQPSPSRSQEQTVPAATKPSRNSIFETTHAILKPAVRMNEEELQALRNGQILETAQSPQELANSSGANNLSSIVVPLTRDVTPGTGGHSSVINDRTAESDRRRSSAYETPQPNVNVGYLTHVNTTAPRGFIELDSSQYGFLSPKPSSPDDGDKPISDIPRSKSPQLLAAEAKALRRAMGIDDVPVIFSPAIWDNISLTFLPTKRNFLGEGRYASVYLGYYTICEPQSPQRALFASSADSPTFPPSRSSSPLPGSATTSRGIPPRAESQPITPLTSISASSPSDTPDFHPCAVKRLHHTPEAQQLGLSEIYILTRLSPLNSNIIKFIGAKDERNDASPALQQRLAGKGSFPSAVRPRPPSSLSSASSPGCPSSPGFDSSQNDDNLEDSQLLILLEYLPNGNMWDWVRQNRKSVGRRLWLKWARQLASAVECMHQVGIVHHDIKPHNILLSDFLDARLADFGNACFLTNREPVSTAVSTSAQPPTSPTLSRGNKPTPLVIPAPAIPLTTSPAPTQTHLPVPPQQLYTLSDGLGRGTEAYSAPELLIPGRAYSTPVDIHSLGVTLFTLITGEMPYPRARSSIQLMMGARKGFFESGLQRWGSLLGCVMGEGSPDPSQPPPPKSYGFGKGSSMQPPTTRFRFLTGEPVDSSIVHLLEKCLDPDPNMRWTASQVREMLDGMDDMGSDPALNVSAV